MVVDTVPEFLLNDEDEDEEDVDVDVDALSPLWPVMSSAGESDILPAVDDILSSFTGVLRYRYHYYAVTAAVTVTVVCFGQGLGIIKYVLLWLLLLQQTYF